MLTDTKISENINKALKDMGFTVPTLIQEQAIPHILEGKDIIGQAQTGTGKTAAFAIPILEMIDLEDRRIQSLILCPTRELAMQTGKEFAKIGKYFPELEVLSVYGGQQIDIQIRALRRYPQVVIGTPGRLIDHINRRTLDLSDVQIVTLDEADEMLDMGFRDDINKILDMTKKNRQTLLFSATMPKPIMELSKKYLNNPTHIKIIDKTVSTDNTQQIYYEVKERNKIEALSRILDFYEPKLSIIFCRTKVRVDDLAKNLIEMGYKAQGLHGDLRQSQRDNIMQLFRSGELRIMVATDVAARGIDVDDIEIVFNFDLPQDAPSYTHRIGRTGRAGKNGMAITFVSGRDVFRLKDFAKVTKSELTLGTIPSRRETISLQIKKYIDTIKENLLTIDNIDSYHEYLSELENSNIDLRDFAIACILDNISTGEQQDRILSGSASSVSQGRNNKRPHSSRQFGPARGDHKSFAKSNEYNFKKRKKKNS